MQKILIISIQRADKTVGGMSYRFMALWEYLQTRSDCDVHLLCTKTLWDKVIGERLEVPDHKVSLMNDTRFYKIKALFLWLRAITIVLTKGINSVHIAGGHYLFLPFYKLNRFFNFKTIITFASNSIKMAAYNNEKIERRWHQILKNVKEIDLLNPTYNLPNYGFKVHVSPSSFPFHLYKNGKQIELPSINRKENIILFVGNLAHTKNPILAIEGFEKFKLNYQSDYRLIIIGRGPLKTELENLIARTKENIGENCLELIYGLPSSDIYDLMKRSKIFLSLQDYDNYPSQSLMEAMIYENIIIATHDGDTNRLVKEEFGNVILKTKKSEELAKAIQSISSRRIEATPNKNLILEQFTLERFAEYFMEIHNN